VLFNRLGLCFFAGTHDLEPVIEIMGYGIKSDWLGCYLIDSGFAFLLELMIWNP
jgi:hypothetical protein